MRLAEEAATEAELCAKLRKEYDARAKKITEDAAAMPDAVKDQVTDMVAKSKAAADAFNFDHANRFLDNAGARIAGGKIATMGPDDPELAGLIRKMLDAKGGEELLVRPTDNPSQPRNPKPGAAKRIASGPELLDEIVKSLPDTVAPSSSLRSRRSVSASICSLSALQRGRAGRREGQGWSDGAGLRRGSRPPRFHQAGQVRQEAV